MAAFSSLAIGAGLAAAGLFGGKKLAESKMKKQLASQQQQTPAAPAPTPAQQVQATNPPDALKETSSAYEQGRQAAARLRRRIPGGGFTGGKVPAGGLKSGNAGYAMRSLLGS